MDECNYKPKLDDNFKKLLYNIKGQQDLIDDDKFEDGHDLIELPDLNYGDWVRIVFKKEFMDIEDYGYVCGIPYCYDDDANMSAFIHIPEPWVEKERPIAEFISLHELRTNQYIKRIVNIKNNPYREDFSLKMIEKEQLINRLKVLYKIHHEKIKEWQKENNYSDEMACITREGVIIASLIPKCYSLGINIQEDVLNG